MLKEFFEQLCDVLQPASPELSTIEAADVEDAQYTSVRKDHKLVRLPGPDRLERAHSFADLGSFAAYVERWAGESTDQTEILVGEAGLISAAIAVADPNAPRVTCQLPEYPTFKAFREILDQALGQRDFHALVRGHRPRIPESEFLLGELAKIKVKRGEDVEIHLDERGFSTFHALTGGTEVSAKVPPEITLETPVYAGVVRPGSDAPTYRLELLVHMTTDNGLAFVLQCPALEVVLLQARADVQAHLEKILGDDFLVGVGDFAVTRIPDSVAPPAAG